MVQPENGNDSKDTDLQHSIEEDFNNWKTLRIEIDIEMNTETIQQHNTNNSGLAHPLLGIDLAYAASIVSSIQSYETETKEGIEIIQEIAVNLSSLLSSISSSRNQLVNTDIEFIENEDLKKCDVNYIDNDEDTMSDDDAASITDVNDDNDDESVDGDNDDNNMVENGGGGGVLYNENDIDSCDDELVMEKMVGGSPLDRLVLINRIEEDGLANGKLK